MEVNLKENNTSSLDFNGGAGTDKTSNMKAIEEISRLQFVGRVLTVREEKPKKIATAQVAAKS